VKSALDNDDENRFSALCDRLSAIIDPGASSSSGAGPAATSDSITSKATGRTYTAAYLNNICKSACFAESIRMFATAILENWDEHVHL
jgi:hypothetical protein